MGGDPVVQLARDAGRLPGHGVFDRLVGESVSRGPGLLSSLGHQALARRLASDSSNAITSGWRSHRRTRSYGRHSRLVSSIAARRRVRSSSITARWASIPSDRARERLTSDAAHTTATTASTKIATALTTRSQTPIVVSTDLLFHVLVFDGGHRVSLAEFDADHTLCVTADRADLGFAEADRLA